MEYSLESIMAIGTGMIASRESAGAQNNGPIEYDGYSDGLDLDIARTSEQLHFMNMYDKLQDMHSAEKLRMIKKINTAYNGKTISNANVANSVESFCNNAMSTEGIKEAFKAFKDKIVAFFKKIAEFFKNLITKIFGSKVKGKSAEELKTSIEEDHAVTAVVIDAIEKTNDDDPEIVDIKESATTIQQSINADREVFMELMASYKDAFEYLKVMAEDQKANLQEIKELKEKLATKTVDTDVVEKFKNKLPKKFVAALDNLKAKLKDSAYAKMKKELVEKIKTKGASEKQGISSIIEKCKDFVKNSILSAKVSLYKARVELKMFINKEKTKTETMTDAEKNYYSHDGD